MIAAKRAKPDLVRLFLDKGMDPNLEDQVSWALCLPADSLGWVHGF